MKIDKNIPRPAPRKPGRPSVYAFDLMKVGDSTEINVSSTSLYATMSRFRRSDPQYESWQFQIVRLGDKQSRVWRTK